MRIQLVLPGLSIGGTEKMVTFLARGLKERGHEVQVISLKHEGPMGEILRSAGVDVITLDTPEEMITGFFDTPHLFRRLKTAIRAFKPDIVQSFLTRANVLTRAAGHQLGFQRIVCSLRVMEQQKKFHLWAERLFLDSHTVFTTNSSSLKQFAIQRIGLKPGQVHVIQNGVEPTRDVSENELNALQERYRLSGKTLILAAGRLHQQKGFDILIEAFGRVFQKNPDIRLIIAGEGEERRNLEQQIEHAELTQSVFLPGVVRDLAPLFRLARFFVLSSRWEGTPNVVLESMMAGCPILATTVGGVTDVVTSADQAILVPAESVDALANGIFEFLRQPEQSRQRAAAARLRVAAFSMSEMIQAYESLYLRQLS